MAQWEGDKSSVGKRGLAPRREHARARAKTLSVENNGRLATTSPALRVQNVEKLPQFAGADQYPPSADQRQFQTMASAHVIRFALRTMDDAPAASRIDRAAISWLIAKEIGKTNDMVRARERRALHVDAVGANFCRLPIKNEERRRSNSPYYPKEQEQKVMRVVLAPSSVKRPIPFQSGRANDEHP